MQQLFIATRTAVADAHELINRFGEDAGFEAALRAERSRHADNVLGYCHWRQIERLIVSLADTDICGTVH
ncbi:hypothetical protein OMW55_13110 [Sphingomonas sp. BN140010]|uniref:Uncharacterized protein n=1 Tax=Sphingomonas arvum TaxID=2992113 RepID=A0ABT3JI54_9SPHN|nr:hypothetical protein [Sphingomonas sp. BN140010]MCW3798748.1 hypothetical protein [Sphingomonas sp. BN140010]